MRNEMKIFNSLEEIDIMDNTAVALGNFDGLHTGHMHLIRSMKKTAEIFKSKHIRQLVITRLFDRRNVDF